MDFRHSAEIWRDFPELVAGAVFGGGITPDVSAGGRVAKFTSIASSRLAKAAESELPEIRAWRRAWSDTPPATRTTWLSAARPSIPPRTR